MITINSVLNSRTSFYLTVPIKNENSRKVMICLHQSTFDNVDEPMGFTKSRNNYARFFAENGYITLTPLIPGFEKERFKRHRYPESNSWHEPYTEILKKNKNWSGVGIYSLMLKNLVDFIFSQDLFDFDIGTISLTGLSHGGILSGFCGPLDKRISTIIPVNGGSHDCLYEGPIYFGNTGKRELKTKVLNFDFIETLALMFPRKIILFNSKNDPQGYLPNNMWLRDLYRKSGVSKRMVFHIQEETITGHRYDLPVQKIIFQDMKNMESEK